jgi:DegV family protein with EDD domain
MKIVTDCAADMPNEELEQLGIVQAPLFIQFPEGEVNSADISADDFYNRLEAMRPQFPTTAQPSAGIFAELYRKIAETDKDIFSVHISSGLSGTINSAQDGGSLVKDVANVKFWDTLTLSGGERFQVARLVEAVLQGFNQHRQERVNHREPQLRRQHLDRQRTAAGNRCGRGALPASV